MPASASTFLPAHSINTDHIKDRSSQLTEFSAHLVVIPFFRSRDICSVDLQSLLVQHFNHTLMIKFYRKCYFMAMRILTQSVLAAGSKQKHRGSNQYLL